jgi:spore germination protein YaaH
MGDFRDSLSAVLLLLLLLPLADSAVQAQNRVVGYHAWWMQDSWGDYDLSLYDKILFFELPVSADGSVTERYGWPENWTDLVGAVHQAGGKVAPTFAILDPTTFSSVLGSRENRKRLEDTVMDLVEAAGADGAHLNFEIFEPSTPAARAGFTQLAQSLSRRLKNYKSSAELTVFLPGFDYGEAYDEVALAGAADYLVVQGYDMHWLNAPTAGPVAPLRGWGGASWEGITARYQALGIDRTKLVMAAPYYGYEWPTVSATPGAETRGEGVPITFAPVSPALLPLIQISASQRIGQYRLQRDPESGSPYYAYRGVSGWYQGWFEDRESLEAKYSFVTERGLGGVSVFLLGYDGGRLEPALRAAFRR